MVHLSNPLELDIWIVVSFVLTGHYVVIILQNMYINIYTLSFFFVGVNLQKLEEEAHFKLWCLVSSERHAWRPRTRAAIAQGQSTKCGERGLSLGKNVVVLL